ncbi:hypothetical protein JL722_994 [Aureococcus anophagefferens]|nr:hypothetical protein JL722_994 [Aureococcus anophagefferens]
MNGRSVLDRAPGVTGLPRCPWTRSSGGTSTFRRGDALRDRLRSAAGTRASRCVTSFETHWDAAVDMAMGDGGPAPLFLTVLRAPLAWAVSSSARRRGTKFRRECDCRGAARRGAARDEELRIAAAKHQENATLESFLRAERGLAEYARLYARADELFRDRCDAVEAATSVKLLCDDSYVVSPAPTAPTAAPTARRPGSEGGRGRERRRAGAAPRGGGHVPRRPRDDGGRAGDSGRARRGVALMCVI